jgi:hypothetical protein
MDKLVTELINPFASRVMATMSLASIVFWTVGLTLVYHRHPGPLPLCDSGGRQLCGILSGEWAQTVVPVLTLAVAVVLLSTMVMAGSHLTLVLLQGTRWWRRIGLWLQERAWERHSERDRNGRSSGAKWFPHGPAAEELLQPTRLGNIFAATHQRLVDRNGFRLSSCLRLLRHVLPAADREDLDRTLNEVARRVQLLEWLVLGTVWAVLLPGVGPKIIWVSCCLLAAFWVYREVCAKAMEYCDEVDAVVVLNRHRLYEGVGLVPPSCTGDEPQAGNALCSYLDRRGASFSQPLRWSADDEDGAAKSA